MRIGAVLLVPSGFFASDEGSYFQDGTDLALYGTQHLFWPPLTGWLIALVTRAVGSSSITPTRVLWHLMDIGVFLMLPRLVLPLENSTQPGAAPEGWRLGDGVRLAYALYMPAIGFATFATSEMPALFIVCLINLVLLRQREITPTSSALAGTLAGLLTLTRTSLAGWVVALPVFILTLGRVARNSRWCAAAATLCAAVVLSATLVRNGVIAGRFVLSTNAYYNLYLGNGADYIEDLNLFRPWATPSQIAYRSRYFANSGSPAEPNANLGEGEQFDRTIKNIIGDPLLFARRATGRLARIFAPKTEELELLGGEGHVRVTSPQALAMLGVTNLEWGAAVSLGIFGLAHLAERHPHYWRVVLLNFCGGIPLCLVAISKPRYAFPFEFFFVVAALHFLGARTSFRDVWARHPRTVLASYAALLWAWIAWGIFALTSRSLL
jgi:hypothetical protein